MLTNEGERDYSRVADEHWPKVLVEIADAIAARLRRSLRLPAEEASRRGRTLSMVIAQAVGGLLIYLPMDEAKLSDELDQLMAEFERGENNPNAPEFSRSEFCIRLQDSCRGNDKALWMLYARRIGASIYGHAKAANETHEQAANCARFVLEELASYGGGKLFVMPSGSRVQAGLDHQEIADKFGRVDAKVLAFQYEMNVVRVYAIAKRELTRRRHARAQGKTKHEGMRRA